MDDSIFYLIVMTDCRKLESLLAQPELARGGAALRGRTEHSCPAIISGQSFGQDKPATSGRPTQDGWKYLLGIRKSDA